MITAGTVTMKYALTLVRLYEQMPDPKYVIAMGACTITRGMFSADSPTAGRGMADGLIDWGSKGPIAVEVSKDLESQQWCVVNVSWAMQS